MSWIPRLRPDVRVEDGALVDPVLRRRLPLGAISAALVPRLDGRPLAEVLGETATACGQPEAEVEDALRTLLLLHQLEGAGAATVRAVREAAPPRPRTLPRARFGCQSSGQCCRVYRPGPLSDEDLARLRAAEPALRAAYPALPQEWVETHPDDEGQPARYLRRTEGGCLFLQPDHRCGVHAAAGYDAKPDPCRAFPFDALRTLDGLRIHDNSQCASFATSSQEGPLHAEAAAGIARLAPGDPRLHHPVALLAPGVPCDYGPLLALEARLLELCERPDRVAACGALARAFADALARCPLGAGEPEATIEALLTRDAAGETPPLPRPEPLALAKATHACASALEDAVARDDEAQAPLADAFLEAVAGLRGLAAARAGLVKGPLPKVLRDALAVALPPEVQPVLAASQRNRLFGGQLLVCGHLQAGVLRLALHEQLTLTAARMRAGARSAPRIEREDLSAGHWTVALALARPTLASALQRVGEHAWTLAAG